MAAHDIDRSVSMTSLKSWNSAISTVLQQDNTSTLLLDERLRVPLITFIQRTVLDPNGVYMYLNPTPPVVPPAPTKKGARKEDPELAARSKAEELEENEQDRRARLRVGAIGAIRWTLGICDRCLSRCMGSEITTRNDSNEPSQGSGRLFQKPRVVEFFTPRRELYLYRYRKLWSWSTERTKIGMVVGANFAQTWKRYVDGFV